LAKSKRASTLSDGRYLASSKIDSKYKRYIIKEIGKNVVDDIDMNFIFATGLDLKDGLLDQKKAQAILDMGKE